MLDHREIDIEIARLEYGESSYAAYAKLADLYIIRSQMDNNTSADSPRQPVSSAGPTSYAFGPPKSGDSDFLAAISGRDPEQLWKIMDDLMSTVQVTAPRAYASVMRKISSVDYL